MMTAPHFASDNAIAESVKRLEYLRFSHFAQDMKVFQDYSAFKSKSLDYRIETKKRLIEELEFQKKKDV
jgi:hypothetical protein